MRPALTASSTVREFCEVEPHSARIMPTFTFWLNGLYAAGRSTAEPKPPVMDVTGCERARAFDSLVR